MQNILALVHLKGPSRQHYDHFAKEQFNAVKHLLVERLHHFVTLSDDEVLMVDIWKSAEVFSKYIDILMPIATKNGFVSKAEISTLYHENL